MTIYVDDPMPQYVGKFHNYCHMWADGTADTIAELDAFAKRLGLRVEWRQFSKGISGDFYHYDISPAKRSAALLLGAEYLPLIKWLKSKLEARRLATPPPTSDPTPDEHEGSGK